MDINLFWLLALAVAAPISGVIGFAIQVGQVKKARLENLKLQLEIEALTETAAKSDRRIAKATPEEISKIGRKDLPSFSRSGDGLKFSLKSAVTEDIPPVQTTLRWKSFRDNAILAGLIALLVLFVFYLLYDLYRFAQWIQSIL